MQDIRGIVWIGGSEAEIRKAIVDLQNAHLLTPEIFVGRRQPYVNRATVRGIG